MATQKRVSGHVFVKDEKVEKKIKVKIKVKIERWLCETKMD